MFFGLPMFEMEALIAALAGILTSWLVLGIYLAKNMPFRLRFLIININFAALSPIISLIHFSGFEWFAETVTKMQSLVCRCSSC